MRPSEALKTRRPLLAFWHKGEGSRRLPEPPKSWAGQGPLPGLLPRAVQLLPETALRKALSYLPTLPVACWPFLLQSSKAQD